MTIERAYEIINQYLIQIIDKQVFENFVLNIELQPKMISYSGKITLNNNKESRDIKLDREVKEAIWFIHTATTIKGLKKWNKLTYTFFPDNKFETEFIWDEEWQNEVDGFNRQAMLEDPTYVAPKWHWEE